MDYKILKNEDFNISEWTGGKTRQLAICPEGSDYLERNFVWRLSSATCELDESDFSYLPDYDRVIVVLKGKVVLAHGGIRTVRLDELEQDRFSGGDKTKSFGRITDYNLMVRKGNEGFAEVLELTADNRSLPVENHPEYKFTAQTFFVRNGYADVTVNGETVVVLRDQQLVIKYESREKVRVSIMGEGNAVRCRIFYN